MNNKYITIVYKYVSSERTTELMNADDAVAGSHSHAISEKNAAMDKLIEKNGEIQRLRSAINEEANRFHELAILYEDDDDEGQAYADYRDRLSRILK